MEKRNNDSRKEKYVYSKPQVQQFGLVKDLIAGGTTQPGDPGVPAGTRHNPAP